MTSPWGSVNSRVFDGLAAGALVLSNGIMGISTLFKDLFDNSQISYSISNITFSTGEQLVTLLDYFLSHERERSELVRVLQQHVLRHHTYGIRAEEFSRLVLPLGVTLPARNHSDLNFKTGSLDDHAAIHEQLTPSNHSTLCVGIRTIESQFPWLELMVQSLAAQYRFSSLRKSVRLQLFIAVTESLTNEFRSILFAMVDRINSLIGSRFASVFFDGSKMMKRKNPFYGYDSTDSMLSYMLTANKRREFDRPWLAKEAKRRGMQDTGALLSAPCEWIMFTNGDNAYNSAWFDTVAAEMLHDRSDFLAWDFVTHHGRQRNWSAGMDPQQLIRVSVKRGFIDLGSAAVKAELYLKSRTLYLPDSIFTKDLFARDYFTLAKLASYTSSERVHLVHRILMFHQ